MRRKIYFLFMLICCMLMSTSAWADDETLFTTNFSTADGWSTESIITSSTTSATKTIKGTTISFKGYKNSDLAVTVGATDSADGKLTFVGNNLEMKSAGAASDANYYMAIPVSGVNGSVTVTTTGSATKWYYTYDDGNVGTVLARQQASANGGFTISGLKGSDVTIYIGANAKYLNSITITTPKAATSAPAFTTDLSATAEVNLNVAKTFSVVASGNPTYQWYKNSTNSTEGATAITGATSSTFSYTATAQGTEYIYCVATNTFGSTPSTLCAATVVLNHACQLIGVQFTNSAYGSIAEAKAASGTEGGEDYVPAKPATVTFPYISGTDVPGVNSTNIEVSAGANATVKDGSITVTAEDGTTTATYTIVPQAITPLEVTADVESTTFTEVPSWVYSPYGYDSTKGLKFGKAVNDASNMRISLGNTRQYYFIGPAKTLTLTSMDAARAINVYVNGTKVESITTTAKKADVKIPLDTENTNMVCIESNQKDGDGGFTAYAITANEQETPAEGSEVAERTATWDFQNASPSTITETNIQNTTNTVASEIEGVALSVNATCENGKLAYNSSGYAQFNKGTIISVPVRHAGDIVTVVSYPGQYKYTVGGTAATDNTTTYTATATDVTAGKVDIVATDGAYLYSISVKQIAYTESQEEPQPEDPNFDIKEKVVYQTKFQDWTKASASADPSEVKVTTTDGKDLTFTLLNTAVDPEGINSKFTDECVTTGYLQTAKDATSSDFVTTSTLASVTKLEIVQAATGTGRGITVYVKGDKDEDWVALHNEGIGKAAGETLTLDVDRENCQIKFGTYAANQNAYVTSMKIYGNVKVAKRTFKDFKIDFRTDPYTVVAPEAGLPEGISVDAGTYKDGQHGAQKATVTVPVDGPVKFTIGGCGYTNKATVSIDGGTALDIDNKTPGCDDGVEDIKKAKYTKYTTYTYNVEKAAILTFNLGNYCPFFFAEACEFIPSVEVSYYNTDGTLIGTETIDGGSELAYKYGEKDVTVPSGQVFRGWFDGKTTTAQKVAEGKAVTEDLKLYAHATAVETTAAGSHYDWDLTKNNFYQEDHELISIENGKYYNNHGWKLDAGGKITVRVRGKCVICVKNCTSSETQKVSYSLGSLTIPAYDLVKNETTDGYVYTQKITTTDVRQDLSFTFPSAAYVHGVEIFYVEDFVSKDEKTGYYNIPAGDASSFLLAVKSAQKGDKIFLPNGTYDLGETVLTTISADSVSIIGESMEGTIIKNAPDKSIEGISTTATLLNTSNALYLQDLTLQNALDYYANNNGRAVCLQDKGDKTVCKNVRMLSYQDTYYSNKVGAKKYFEDGEIHGTVDYICGDGSVYFKGVGLVCEKRQAKGGGSDAITASNADDSDKGYVLDGCTIKYAEGMTESELPVVSLGRSWGNAPQCVYLNTIVNNANGTVKFQDNNNPPTIVRWTLTAMNALPKLLGEYNTVNQYGDPAISGTNSVTFTLDKTSSKDMDTYLTAEQAATYTADYVLGGWAKDAQADATQVTEMPSSTGGLVYLVPGDGTTVSYITTTCPESGKVRIANGRGGFGPAITLGVAATDLYVIGLGGNWTTGHKMTETKAGEEWTYDFGDTELVGNSFKIKDVDPDWKGINLGMGNDGLAYNTTIDIYQNSSNNISVSDIYKSATNVVITLKKDAEGNYTLYATGTFEKGEATIPDLYLRGIQYGWDDCTDDNKFTRDGDNYVWTLSNVQVDDDYRGQSFKVADSSWGTYQFGYNEGGVKVGDEYLMKQGSGDLKFDDNFPAGTYDFTVTKDGANWTLTVTVATGINAVSAVQNDDAPIYNVAGQRVNASAKGILIQGGKKYVK